MNQELDQDVGKRFTVVFLDDAQSQYEDKDFWTGLIKYSPRWMSTNIRFIISATHLLACGVASPVEFVLLKKLKREEFLLSDSEARQLLNFPITGLPDEMKSENVLQFLIGECGGLVGALRMAIDFLQYHFRKEPRGIKPKDSLVLQMCLSREFNLEMARCFGTGRLDPNMDANDIKFVKRCFVEDYILAGNLANEEKKSHQWLEMAGILVTSPDNFICFSSPLAKRYIFEKIFPERNNENPTSLDELIEKVIGSMSAHTLSQSTVQRKFPKEAVFQHLFMAGLALHTKPTCAICPELSKRFPGGSNASGGDSIDGEIDFYLDGDLRWGIELLVCGRGIGEHLSRFDANGKYSSLDVKDYVVVDLRQHKTVASYNISKKPKRITVFFDDGDFTVAKCLFKLENDMRTIHLC
ncbi:Aste57867_4320 [Aphanomyces stellatus]|uniref:Aste57867_4320 protein n=1 Tax=Aphanomyces stellatus TaxID=120398 RepID=A0A485KDM7_9STRA|nr:hypothetical protein As57867_004309 [Aphanomyces stellatus]VFT81434.1 Aste57867_4320 [Aphanomyces stellatus]